ncbi:Non-structural maintenance of chromosomes element 1 [Terramyces sp. JEL0728]|nr:Non-structural maintenance of chromosomes element 1 [Terramyces sp. JEL0728]
MTEFGNANRLFLSHIISHKILSSDSAKQLYNKCKQFTNSSFESYVEFMKITNAGLELVDMKIRRGADPFSGDKFICLVNCKADEISLSATNLNANEIDSILTSDSTSLDLSSTDALNSCSKLVPPITKQAAEIALDKLVADNWLISVKGRISLGLSSILELDLYLKQQFADYIKTCLFCKEVILNKHEYCDTNDCNAVAHVHCIAKNPTKKCPECREEWLAALLPCSIETNTIDAAIEDDEISQQVSQAITNGSAQPSNESENEIGISDNESAISDTEKHQSHKRKQSETQKSAKSSQKRTRNVIESDDSE